MALCPPHRATCEESRLRGPRTRARHSDATSNNGPPPLDALALPGLSAGELKLAHTLPTGQAFGWRRSGDEYHGVLGDAAVAVREHPSTKCCEWRAAADREADAKRRLDDYFRTQTSFEELYAGWSASDERFAAQRPPSAACAS